MLSTAEIRSNYEKTAREGLNSPYRRVSEYAGYLDRFLHSESIVDGMTYEERLNKLPMPYNMYFG